MKDVLKMATAALLMKLSVWIAQKAVNIAPKKIDTKHIPVPDHLYQQKGGIVWQDSWAEKASVADQN